MCTDCEKSIEVRVSLTTEGVLEPKVRSTPKVCQRRIRTVHKREKCKGGTFTHCLKEKATWNAEKLGFYVRGSALDTHFFIPFFFALED